MLSIHSIPMRIQSQKISRVNLRSNWCVILNMEKVKVFLEVQYNTSIEKITEEKQSKCNGEGNLDGRRRRTCELGGREGRGTRDTRWKGDTHDKYE